MPLTDQSIQKAAAIAKRYGVSKLLLFGSALENLETARDLDLPCEGIRGWNQYKLAGEIENELLVNVDLVSMEDSNSFTDHNRKVGRLIYG